MRRRSSQARAHDWLDLAALLDPLDHFATPPPRDAAEWRHLYGFATAHLVAPTLYAVLAARKRLDWLPEEICAALAVLHALNAEHNQRLRDLLHETTARLNGVGVRPIALKGAIALLPEADPVTAARVLGDLDLWVGEADLPAAIQALRAGGYRLPDNLHPQAWSQPPSHHAPPLLHPSGSGYVELHQRVFDARVPAGVLGAKPLTTAARWLEWRGVRLGEPALRHRLIHNALHHLVTDQGFASDRRSLRQLFEFARLLTRPEAATLDWAGLLGDLDGAGMGEALRLNLLASLHLFGQPLPLGVRLTPAALAAEGRFWWRLDQPVLNRGLEWRWFLRVQARRLANLPRQLARPAWYPMKFHELKWAWLTHQAGRQLQADLSPCPERYPRGLLGILGFLHQFGDRPPTPPSG